MYKIIGADGQQYGPVPMAEIKNWVRSRRANGETLVQGPDLGEWKPMKLFPEFADVLMPGTAAALPPAGMSAGQVPDYLPHAIVCTLCCCLPFGVVAIVYASQVKTKLGLGDNTGAYEAAQKAKMWCWISFGLGIITNLVLLALQFVFLAAS